jgi:redox-sensitive bicupin YhaK (pirin superfamily)
MVAARGIEHQEFPGLSPQGFWAFQLWINLDHMARLLTPSYQNLPAESIPVTEENGVLVRHVLGPTGAIKKPCRNLHFLDVTIQAGSQWSYALPASHQAWLLGLGGILEVQSGDFRETLKIQELGLLTAGDSLHVSCFGNSPARFLLVAGEPVREPIFWYGPFVARNSEEMRLLVQRMR